MGIVRRADEFSPLFQRMLDAPDAMLEAMRDDHATFERRVLEEEANKHVAGASLLDRHSLVFLLFDKQDARIESGSAWMPELLRFDDLMQHVDARSSDGRIICIAQATMAPVFGIWAYYTETARWNLPESVREQADLHQAGKIAIFAGNLAQPVQRAVAAFGLAPHLQRIVAAVVMTGNVRDAAVQTNISYASAREAMSAATRRLRLANTPAVVRAVVSSAFGFLPGGVETPVQLADMLSISERQARIALLISSGASREATARALGTSTAVIKKELHQLFATVGAKSAAELARLITEAQALKMFARSIDNAPGFLDPAIEPSRYSIRPNGRGLIAWSDYGPASAQPVLVVHSNWCCRAVPLPLVRELNRRKWRPLSIDRPGFGATHIGASCREDPFTQAIEDTIQILDELKISRIPIIARCGAQFVHALAVREPDRIGPVVLVSPTPPANRHGKRFGPVGAFKEAFYRSPRLIELFFRVISSQFSFDRVAQLMRSITKGSPVDEALCEDPQFIRDRFRALRPFACGGYSGGILEEMIISHGGWTFEPIDGHGWSIIQGAQDVHQDISEMSYWRALLPDASFCAVQDGGRFMTSSHPELVVDLLERAQVEYNSAEKR